MEGERHRIFFKFKIKNFKFFNHRLNYFTYTQIIVANFAFNKSEKFPRYVSMPLVNYAIICYVKYLGYFPFKIKLREKVTLF